MARLTRPPDRIAPAPARLAPPPKVADPFYLSAEWRALVDSIKQERGNRCEECGAAGVKLIGDHVHEVKDGGAKLDSQNIRLLCWPCHNQKTAEAKRARVRS